MTAAFGLYQRLGLPVPWRPTNKQTPLVIYGASGAVGSFAIQMAIQSNIHPLICVAGKSREFVETLIDKSKGDVVLDYRVGGDELVKEMAAVVLKTGGTLDYAFDCISSHGSYLQISQVLEPRQSKIALILPGATYEGIPPGITQLITYVGDSHKRDEKFSRNEETGTLVGNEEFAFTFFRYFGRGLQKGFFKGHPYEVVPGGLDGVETALINLKEGKASAVKYVFRVGDTKGAGQDGA